MNVLILLEVVVAHTGNNSEGVGTEEVSLTLDKVGGKGLGSVTVEEGQGGGVGRDGNTPESGLSDDSPPAGLGLFEGLGEEGSKEEVLEFGVLSVGSGDVRKEDGLDDTATSPHSSDTGVVQVPVVNLGSFTHEHEALGVRDDLGGVKSLLKVVNELLLVTLECLLGGTGDDLGGPDSLVLNGREASGEDGLTDKGNGHTVVEGVNGSPLTGTLLAGLVKDLSDHGDTVSVLELENVSGDLNEERVEDTAVPLVKDASNLVLIELKTSLEDVVGLSDQLHVSVLDTVVDHLNVVAGTGLTNPVTARLTLGLSSGLLEDLLNVGPGGIRTTGHKRRTVSGTLLTTRDTRADKQETLGLELMGSSDRVGVVGVTTVNDDVTLLEVRLELSNEVVDGLTSLDEEDDSPRPLELSAELLNGVGANDVGALSLVRKEVVNLGDGSVVGTDLEALVVHVKDQVLTHDGQTNKTNVGKLGRHLDSVFFVVVRRS